MGNVNIIIPLGTSDQPIIDSIDGNSHHDASNGRLIWSNQVIDTDNNPSGTIEFTVSGHDPDVFFPIYVEFQSSKLYVDADIVSVLSLENNPVPYSMTKSLFAEGYTWYNFLVGKLFHLFQKKGFPKLHSSLLVC